MVGLEDPGVDLVEPLGMDAEEVLEDVVRRSILIVVKEGHHILQQREEAIYELLILHSPCYRGLVYRVRDARDRH